MTVPKASCKYMTTLRASTAFQKDPEHQAMYQTMLMSGKNKAVGAAVSRLAYQMEAYQIGISLALIDQKRIY